MLSPIECVLKAENYAAAACLDPTGEHLSDYLRLAAMWRARAVHLKTGGRMEQISEPFEQPGDEQLWS
jgi:hypothetical protein